jgi:Ca2+-binding RTX toxin-like protein
MAVSATHLWCLAVTSPVATPFFSTIDVTVLDPSDGFLISGGSAVDLYSLQVSGAGDVNGDGYDDLIVRAIYGSDGGTEAGEAYVIYGKPPSLDLRDDTGANPLTGDANDDTLRGLDGDDTLRGELGADLLRGGPGDDLLHGNAGDDTLFGNEGEDTLYGGLGDDVMFGKRAGRPPRRRRRQRYA